MIKHPIWFWAASGAGLLWNAYGLWQFAGSVTATTDSLVASGQTLEQAAVMTTYPAWMTVSFVIGVLAGSVLLMLRCALAVTVLVVSLMGYIVIYLGDITQGVFAVMGAPQVIILSVVVAIAVGLLARHAKKKLLLA